MVQVSEDPFFGDAAWTAATPTSAWQFDQNDGERTIYARFRDSAAIEFATIRAHTAARPHRTDRPRYAARQSGSTIEIQAHDALSGVDAMQISSDGNAGQWQPYKSSLLLTQAIAASGNIQIRLRDTAGNESQPLSVASPLYLPIVIR